MLLEVVIPSFNGQENLNNTLKSILDVSKSGLIKDVKFSLHINGSNDDSQVIAQRYKTSIANFNIYVHDKNLGFDQNLTRALMNVDAEYVFFFGDDDIMLSGFVSVVDELRKTKDSWNLVHLNYFFINHIDGLSNSIQISPTPFIESMDSKSFLARHESTVSAISSNIFRTLLLKEFIPNKSERLDWIHLIWVYKIIAKNNLGFGFVSAETIAIMLENPRWAKNFGSVPVVALNHLIIYRRYLKKTFPTQYLKFKNERYKILKFSLIYDLNLTDRLKYAFRSYREFWSLPTSVLDLGLKIMPATISRSILSFLVKLKKLVTKF